MFYGMKKFFYLMVLLVLISCSDQLIVDEMAGERAMLAPASEVGALIEKARWGDGQAYLMLADCYRDGRGVQKDFLAMMCMTMQAEVYGGISHSDDYLKKMAEDEEFRLIFDAVNLYERNEMVAFEAKREQLISMGSPYGSFLKGLYAIEKKDSIEGIELVVQAATKGSALAELMLCVPDWCDTNNPDAEKLKMVADRIPMAYRLLGDYYSGMDNINTRDDDQAVLYYKKADEYAYLGRRAAKWLLDCYERTGAPVATMEMKRLRKLSQYMTNQ